jgi:hypothetical protein
LAPSGSEFSVLIKELAIRQRTGHQGKNWASGKELAIWPSGKELAIQERTGHPESSTIPPNYDPSQYGMARDFYYAKN